MPTRPQIAAILEIDRSALYKERKDYDIESESLLGTEDLDRRGPPERQVASQGANARPALDRLAAK